MRHTDQSPFFSRAYGGYSKEQILFARPHIDPLEGVDVLDPMAGQAYFLTHGWTPYARNRLWLGDINPGPLMLATLRDHKLTQRADSLCGWLIDRISSLPASRHQSSNTYCEDWISPETRDYLMSYVESLRFPRIGDITDWRSAFWGAPAKIRFAVAIAVLAARDLACFTASDNITWLKQGGLQKYTDPRQPMLQAIDNWHKYARQAGTSSKNDQHIFPMDASHGQFGRCPAPNVVITSPPYANRLDYSRMWAPELHTLSAMFSLSSDAVKTAQIGSTVVEGRWPEDKKVLRLPAFIRRTLRRIRDDDSAPYSKIYYYPFFANYVVELVDSLEYLIRYLQNGGLFILFVRDTTRKDHLLEVGKLVEQIFREHGLKKIRVSQRIIRNHLGMLRPSGPATVYGMAQREWWIIYQKL